MNKTKVYHRSDLMDLLDARPHEFRAWLCLEPLASRTTKPRSATAYSALDALFLLVIKKLDIAGFSPKALKKFSGSLYESLQCPVAEGTEDELLLYLDGDGNWQLGSAPVGSDAVKLNVPLRTIRLQVLHFTGAHLISGQTEMNLLGSISPQKTRQASNKKKMAG